MRRDYCLNLFGTLWVRDPAWLDADVINHERIHNAQMRELLFIPFYLLYIIEWLFRLFLYMNQDEAYRSISFEREAYAHEYDHSYLSRRPCFASFRYFKKPY